MNVKLDDKELEKLVREYLLESDDLKNKENFQFYLVVEYHEGNYDVDSWYSIESAYSYTERVTLFGNEIEGVKTVFLTFKEIFEIINILFEREGYDVKFNYYFRHGISFQLNKIEQMKLVKGVNNESNK